MRRRKKDVGIKKRRKKMVARKKKEKKSHVPSSIKHVRAITMHA
jgi:hypothetical protein